MQLIKILIAILYGGIIVLLGVATFIEQANGTAYAHKEIYGTLWFSLLWAALVLLATIYYIKVMFRNKAGETKSSLPKGKSHSRISVHLLHASLLLIMVGAGITHFTGKEGEIHLRKGVPTNTYIEKKTKEPTDMPLQLTLREFRVEYNPGTNAPTDFISEVQCHYISTDKDSRPRRESDKTLSKSLSSITTDFNATISMNKILNTNGYRFYQSSFDPDKNGTILSINHDPIGILTTYIGYLLFAISMILILLSRKGEFRRLINHPSLRKTIVLLLLITCCNEGFANRTIPTINSEKANAIARQQVMYNDRVAPFSTVAHDFIQKIYGKSNYKGLSAEQVIIGWMKRPDAWKTEKMIKIKDDNLRRSLGIDGKYASMDELFDAKGNYRLLQMLQKGDVSKGARELDEKVGLIILAVNGELTTPVPKGVQLLSDSQINVEILYNTIPFNKVLFMYNLTLGFLLFFLFIIKSEWYKKGIFVSISLMILAFIILLVSYIMRWYIAGRIPLANGFETMQFLALAIMAITIFLSRRFPFMVSFGFLLSGFILLVAHLGQMSPKITPLMPVLNSPLLSSHVSLIMMAYALLALITLNGLYALFSKESETIEQLTVLSRLMLYPAIFFLGTGIFLGATWANISWGRYWSWDPKEVWALITFMLYAVPLHNKSIPLLQKVRWFHLYLVLAFLAVLMTYFGVNYFLGGMHSYA